VKRVRADVMLEETPPTEPRMTRSAFPVAAIAALVVVGGCKTGPTPEEIEAAKNSVDCERPGEHFVIRYDHGEARILIERVRTQVGQPQGIGWRLRLRGGHP